MFMPDQLLSFPVLHRSGAVYVRGELVEFCSSLMRMVWHVFPNLVRNCNARSLHFPDGSISNTFPQLVFKKFLVCRTFVGISALSHSIEARRDQY
jgi:hypothetical protein